MLLSLRIEDIARVFYSGGSYFPHSLEASALQDFVQNRFSCTPVLLIHVSVSGRVMYQSRVSPTRVEGPLWRRASDPPGGLKLPACVKIEVRTGSPYGGVSEICAIN